MKAFFRGVLSVIAGLGTAMVLIILIEIAGHRVYPPPAGIDTTRPEAMDQIVRAMPAGAFGFLIAGWAVGVAGGTWVATKLAGGWKFAPAFVVGGLIQLGALANFLMISHPAWVQLAGLLVIPLATGMGIQFAKPEPETDAEPMDV